jgi:hypothetical protein
MKRFLLTGILIFGLAGCAVRSTTTPPVPATPVNVQVSAINKTLADSLQTADRGVIVARDNKIITEAETVKIQNYIIIAAQAGKATDKELASADPWSVQQSKIIQIWISTGLSAAKSNLTANGNLILQTVIVVVNQVLVALGGPTI